MSCKKELESLNCSIHQVMADNQSFVINMKAMQFIRLRWVSDT